jgi:PAS domain S-box-containing protein
MTQESALDRLNLQQVLLDRAQSGLSYVDPGLRLRYATPAFDRWFGRAAGSMVGMSLGDAMGAALFAQCEPYLQAALAGAPQSFQLDVPGPDGKMRPSVVHCTPHWRDGVVVGLVVELVDVSPSSAAQPAPHRSAATDRARSQAEELAQVERAARLSDARLRSIFESALDGILTVDEQQVIVQANPAAARMFGCRADAMVGMPIEHFIPPQYRAHHRAEVQAFGASPVHARHMGAARRVMALRADGTEFPIEASISHTRVDGRQAYTVIHRDDTERVRQENALRQGEAKLRAALDSMTDAVFISDTKGRLLELNEGFVRFHRFADLASCRRTLAEYPDLLEVFTSDGRPAPLEQWAIPRALRGEMCANVEYRLRRRDTGQAWIGSYSFGPIRDADGAIVGSVVVGRDITEIKAAQLDLQASHAALQRMIAAQDQVQDEERARIARELHDDLQQTLAAIRIDLGELQLRPAELTADQRALVAELDGLAAQAIASLRRVVDDLRPMMLEDRGLAQALQLLGERFERHNGVACSVDADESLDDALQSQPVLAGCLLRVAQEALNNVAKHSKASKVKVDLARVGDSQVTLSVLDDGLGIQARDRRKTESFGIEGMRERVRARGGRLRVDRGPDGGTLVEAMVSLSEAPAAGAGPDSPADLPQRAIAVDCAAPPVATEPDGLEQAPLLRLLNHTARQAVQVVIDGIAGSTAVLDRKGIVEAVNLAWIAFAAGSGHPDVATLGPGVDYLEVCRRAARADPSVLPTLEGLSQVIEGRALRYECEYRCDSPAQRRWFRMEALRMANGNVLVTHHLAHGKDRTPD